MSRYELGNFCVDESRPMKVVVIGAGYSGKSLNFLLPEMEISILLLGIISGIRLRQKVKNIDLVIYEANNGIGGTWLVNKYPGLACDIPSHCYQLTFENNKHWSSFYSPGPEILQYLEGVVDKYKLRPFVKLQHRVSRLRYNETSGKWHISVAKPIPGNDNETEMLEDTADIVISAVGNLRIPSWPEIPGIETFEGGLIHSADWKTQEGEGAWEDTVKTWGNKRIGVIGVGSSAIQIVASLQPRVKHLVNYVRGKTWISGTFVKDKLLELSGGEELPNCQTVPDYFNEQDFERFKDDHQYQEWRRELEGDLNVSIRFILVISHSSLSQGGHLATIHGHPINEFAQEEFKKDMLQRLAKRPWIADHLIPDFSIACRRLTPGPGYLEALCEDNCDFVPTPIKRILAGGIETVDGKIQKLDVIICATGFDTSCKYEFPILGRNGLDLADKYTPYPQTYLGLAVEGFPNFFHAFGPNSGVGAGSLLLIIERQIDYIVKAILKMQRERLKSMEVKKEAVNDFDEYLVTAFGQKCRSWYKVGKSEDGRIVALWPGSPLHAAKTFEHPRWEDFNYERLDGDRKNRFYFLGDGSTVADVAPGEDSE
ncbi:Putative sterigmatocystin biosynthesis monooxygenase stcW [Leucoagaricus sp. SymC.cos]|nr:Putative sterigmatocystin biosynthesis monooxygenase stcW [Leucoagaricus sp. SymC.cos]